MIREVVPDGERAMILDNMGLTQSFTIMAYVDNGTVSDSDGEILVSLKPGHRPTAEYVAQLREELPRRFPGCTFYFEPADITGQILNVRPAGPDQRPGGRREPRRRTSQSRRSSGGRSPRSPAPRTSTSTRSPTARTCGWTWTGSWRPS